MQLRLDSVFELQLDQTNNCFSSLPQLLRGSFWHFEFGSITRSKRIMMGMRHASDENFHPRSQGSFVLFDIVKAQRRRKFKKARKKFWGRGWKTFPYLSRNIFGPKHFCTVISSLTMFSFTLKQLQSHFWLTLTHFNQ